jgi:hypothetical protein
LHAAPRRHSGAIPGDRHAPPIAQAIWYALNRWDGLARFLDDGRIEIGSNTVEPAMRPIALSRKNALFAGSDEGAENWAMLASPIDSCKLHNVNPEAYLTYVFTSSSSTGQGQLHLLLSAETKFAHVEVNWLIQKTQSLRLVSQSRSCRVIGI